VSIPSPDPEAIARFWAEARPRIAAAEPHLDLPADPPAAWGFGATSAHADGLLALVLDGVKTGTASALWDYEASGDELPRAGQLDIILDGAGAPRAVIVNTALAIVPFDEVDEGHAFAEGEGDRTLAAWRDVHERFFTAHAQHDRGFRDDMPVVVERFRLLHP